jgi:hypothetical protein
MVRWWRRENPRRVGLKSGQSSWTKAIDFLGQIFSLPTKTHHHLVQTPSHVPPAQSPIKKSYYSVSTQIKLKLNHSRRARASREREEDCCPARPPPHCGRSGEGDPEISLPGDSPHCSDSAPSLPRAPAGFR